MKEFLMFLLLTGVGYSDNFNECDEEFKQWFKIQEELETYHLKSTLVLELKSREEVLNEFLQSECG